MTVWHRCALSYLEVFYVATRCRDAPKQPLVCGKKVVSILLLHRLCTRIGVVQNGGSIKRRSASHILVSEGCEIGNAVSPHIDDSGVRQVGDDSTLDREAATEKCNTEIGASVATEDWLSLHPADLMRRIQNWAHELAERESQLGNRISQQHPCELRFRALQEISVARTKENIEVGY